MRDTGYTLAILAVAYAVVHAAPLATTLTVATLNVRTKSRNESTLNPAELPWDLRKGAMIQSILDEQPDVIAFQEPREDQVKDLEEGLAPKYSCISILVWEGGDMLATCWNTETTESHLQSHFWLSETPDTPYSKGWDATFARAALMANFRLKSTNELFWAVNTHLDAAGAKAREEEAKLIISRLRPLIRGDTGLGAPPESLIFLLGDFNAVRDTPAYTILTGSRYNLEEGASPEPDTFRDQRRDFGSDQDTPTSDSFGTPKDPKSIDYIMNAVNNGLAKHWSVDAVDILNNEMTHEGKTYIYSDHRMVISRLSCSSCTSTTTPSDPTIDEPTPDTPIPDGPSPDAPVPNNEDVSRAMKTMRLGIKQE